MGWLAGFECYLKVQSVHWEDGRMVELVTYFLANSSEIIVINYKNVKYASSYAVYVFFVVLFSSGCNFSINL